MVSMIKIIHLPFVALATIFNNCNVNKELHLSTSNLIRPSYTIRATISEKVFWPKTFPKTEYFPTKRKISVGHTFYIGCLKIYLCSIISSHNAAFTLPLLIELHLLPLLQPSQAQASNFNKKREGKNCIMGTKYAAKEYLPPPQKRVA